MDIVEKIKNTVEKGIYYNPAASHYISQGETPGYIYCDRCYVGNLPVCIGYEDCDLCLTCLNELIEKPDEIIIARRDFCDLCQYSSCRDKLITDSNIESTQDKNF